MGGWSKSFRMDPPGRLKVTADWARFDAMTEEEAYQNALDDPDNPPLTAEQLRGCGACRIRRNFDSS